MEVFINVENRTWKMVRGTMVVFGLLVFVLSAFLSIFFKLNRNLQDAEELAGIARTRVFSSFR